MRQTEVCSQENQRVPLLLSWNRKGGKHPTSSRASPYAAGEEVMSLGVSDSKEGVASSGAISQPNHGEDGCMNKRTIFLAVSLMIFAFSLAHGATMSPREFNIDRPGGDYRDFPLRRPDPTVCESQCALEPVCMAWNYDTGGGPRCFLKNVVTDAVRRRGLVSGVKILCATMGLREFNIGWCIS